MIAMETTKSEETWVCTDKKGILVSFGLVIIATRIILISQLLTGVFLSHLPSGKKWNLESPELLGQQNPSRHTIFFLYKEVYKLSTLKKI